MGVGGSTESWKRVTDGTQASEGRRETLPHALSHIPSLDLSGVGGEGVRARAAAGLFRRRAEQSGSRQLQPLLGTGAIQKL